VGAGRRSDNRHSLTQQLQLLESDKDCTTRGSLFRDCPERELLSHRIVIKKRTERDKNSRR